MSDLTPQWQSALDRLSSARRRTLSVFEPLPGGRIRDAAGAELVNFSGNDYLGLSRHPELIRRAADFALRYGAGAGASRLVTGNLPPFAGIEARLAAAKGTEAALVFVSGVQANLTILPALLDRQTLGAEPLVYADRLNHASLIQGCIAAGVRQHRFRHNDLNHLEELLARDAALSRPRFIVTESVFSMDGDRTDIPALAALADHYGAFLYIDEAHATGVLGENGFGLAHALPQALVMGTFSKGLGGFGAYAAGSGVLRDYLVNRCGGLIYATALPPAVLGAMDAALDLVPALDGQRAHLAGLGERLRGRLRASGLDTGASTTQIVPLILGAEEKALAFSARLRAEGFLAVAIRPPTVPAGTARLRIALSALHDTPMIDRFADTIIRLARTP